MPAAGSSLEGQPKKKTKTNNADQSGAASGHAQPAAGVVFAPASSQSDVLTAMTGTFPAMTTMMGGKGTGKSIGIGFGTPKGGKGPSSGGKGAWKPAGGGRGARKGKG